MSRAAKFATRARLRPANEASVIVMVMSADAAGARSRAIGPTVLAKVSSPLGSNADRISDCSDRVRSCLLWLMLIFLVTSMLRSWFQLLGLVRETGQAVPVVLR